MGKLLDLFENSKTEIYSGIEYLEKRIKLEWDTSNHRYRSRYWGEWIEELRQNCFLRYDKIKLTVLEKEIIEMIENSIAKGQLTKGEKETYRMVGKAIFDRQMECYTALDHEYKEMYQIKLGFDRRSFERGKTFEYNYKRIIGEVEKISTSCNDKLLNEIEISKDIEDRIEKELEKSDKNYEEKKNEENIRKAKREENKLEQEKKKIE